MNLSSFILIFTMTITFCPLDRAQLLLSLKNSSSIFMANNNRLSTVDSITNDLRIHRQHYSDRRYKLSSKQQQQQKRNSTNTVAMKLSHRIKQSKSMISSSSSSLPTPGKWEPIWNELFPRPKSISSVRFYLYSRLNPDNGHELCIDDHESIKQSNYNPNKRTIFLINGWQDNRLFARWVRDAIRLLLLRDDQNVIFVGWRSLNELFVAAMIIQSYSLYLARFINFLKSKYHLNGEQIHCIGHSLGGFMCGFAGNITFIGRITVMDAGPRPYFQRKPSHQRLNRFQAGFMDVIHSDFHPIFSLGLTIPYGDIDFFPNSGTPQPGCWQDKLYKPMKELTDSNGDGPLTSLFQFPRYLLFCSHYRSHEWFFESIWNQQCQFIGVLCPNYQMFINGECGCEDLWIDGHGETTCALMGYDAEYAILKQGLTKFSPQGKWYLKTSDFIDQTKHHCQYQYQLIVKLGQFIPHNNIGNDNDSTTTTTTTTVVVTIVTKSNDDNKMSNNQIILNEKLYPRHYPQLRPNHRLSKLIIRPHSLPLKRIEYILVSLQSSSNEIILQSNLFITISWIKLAPIHVVQNEPLFFCHLDHYIWPGKSNMMKPCSTH